MARYLEKRALLIAGPTASGKSALALRLARERAGAIVNADALQVYRELRILTARPSPQEEAAAPHRLYGYVSGQASHSVARWLADAAREIAQAWEEGLLPIVVGGTGLYFRALEQGLAEVPEIDPAVRETWRSFDGDLHQALAARDPASAAKLNPNDRQRLRRALEVADSTGRTLADWQAVARGQAVLAGVAVERLYLAPPREELVARAAARFDRMMAAGALDEVRGVMALDPGLAMMKAIGVPELAACLRGETDIEAAVAGAKAATRQYIKRQTTWWRGQMGHWKTIR